MQIPVTLTQAFHHITSLLRTYTIQFLPVNITESIDELFTSGLSELYGLRCKKRSETSYTFSSICQTTCNRTLINSIPGKAHWIEYVITKTLVVYRCITLIIKDCALKLSKPAAAVYLL